MVTSPRKKHVQDERISHEFTIRYLKEYADKTSKLKLRGLALIESIEEAGWSRSERLSASSSTELEREFKSLLASISRRVQRIQARVDGAPATDPLHTSLSVSQMSIMSDARPPSPRLLSPSPEFSDGPMSESRPERPASPDDRYTPITTPTSVPRTSLSKLEFEFDQSVSPRTPKFRAIRTSAASPNASPTEWVRPRPVRVRDHMARSGRGASPVLSVTKSIFS